MIICEVLTHKPRKKVHLIITKTTTIQYEYNENKVKYTCTFHNNDYHQHDISAKHALGLMFIISIPTAHSLTLYTSLMDQLVAITLVMD